MGFFRKSSLFHQSIPLKQTVKKLYQTKALIKFYRSKEFKILIKKMSLYGLYADYRVVYKKYPVTEEELSAIEKFILKNVTHQVTLDTITLTLWVLKQHYVDGKLGLGPLLLYSVCCYNHCCCH